MGPVDTLGPASKDFYKAHRPSTKEMVWKYAASISRLPGRGYCDTLLSVKKILSVRKRWDLRTGPHPSMCTVFWPRPSAAFRRICLLLLLFPAPPGLPIFMFSWPLARAKPGLYVSLCLQLGSKQQVHIPKSFCCFTFLNLSAVLLPRLNTEGHRLSAFVLLHEEVCEISMHSQRYQRYQGIHSSCSRKRSDSIHNC